MTADEELRLKKDLERKNGGGWKSPRELPNLKDTVA